MKKIHTVVAVVGLGVFAAAAWWQQRGPAKPASGAIMPAAQTGAAATGGPAAGRTPGGPGAGGPATVEVALAETQTLSDEVQAVGSLKSAQGVMLRPEVSGRVAKLGFADGQRVKRGQLLVQLDDSLQQAQLKQAEAQASIARTNLQRSRELQAQNFVSQSAVDQNAAAVQVADAQVALAQVQVQRMRVLAPFDGTAGLRSVDVGDYVKDGADLVNIEDLSSLTVQFTLPERYAQRVSPGQAVDVSFDAMPGRNFKGKVQAVDSQVDANGRALQVLATLGSPGQGLRPGMFARARVVFSVREAAVLVPEEALVPVGAKQFLFKVVDGADGKKVSQRIEARLGMRLRGKVEVLADVKAGDLLVTAGHGRLMRGDAVPVRVVDLSKPQGQAKSEAGKPADAKAGPKAAGVGAGSSTAPAAAAGPTASGARAAPAQP